MPSSLINSMPMQVDLDGPSVEVSSQYWGTENEWHFQEPTHNLRFRLAPQKLNIEHCMTNGQSASFGSLMFFPATSVTKAKAKSPELAKLLILRFTDQWVRELTDCSFNLSNVDPDHLADIQSPKMTMDLQKLFLELNNPGLASKAMARSIAETIIIDLLRFVDHAKYSFTHPGGGTLSRSQLNFIDEYIAGTKIAEIKIETIALELGISTSHLRRLFKNTVGKSLRSRLEDQKRNLAVELLTHTTLPLKVIAHKLGFEQVSTFITAFKRLTKSSPGNFRRSLYIDDSHQTTLGS